MSDGAIRHHKAIFMFKIFSVPGCALDRPFHEGRVFGVDPLENALHGWRDGAVVLEDSKGFF
jgi:hypothetical protein